MGLGSGALVAGLFGMNVCQRHWPYPFCFGLMPYQIRKVTKPHGGHALRVRRDVSCFIRYRGASCLGWSLEVTKALIYNIRTILLMFRLYPTDLPRYARSD